LILGTTTTQNARITNSTIANLIVGALTMSNLISTNNTLTNLFLTTTTTVNARITNSTIANLIVGNISSSNLIVSGDTTTGSLYAKSNDLNFFDGFEPLNSSRSWNFIDCSADGQYITGVVENGYIYTSLLDSQFFKHTDLIIEILVAAFQNDPEKDKFFNSFFDKLAGSDKLRNQIVSGMSAQEIKNSWKNEVVLFKQKRKQYLRYEDFE
jgi:hypothetical protein